MRHQGSEKSCVYFLSYLLQTHFESPFSCCNILTYKTYKYK